MTTVAVTGGTGRIGAPLVRALVRSGRTVRALTRRARAPEPGVAWVTGDLNNEASLVDLVTGAETVYHAAGQLAGDAAQVERSLVDRTAAILRLASGIRVVHLSSLVVVETASRTPHVIDEQSPLEPTPGRRGIYTRAKAAAEQLVRDAAAHQDVVIVRPGLVLDLAASLPPAVGWCRRGWVFLVGPGNGLLPAVSAEDVAAGLLLAADRLPAGGILHLIDPQPASRIALLELLSAGGGRRRVVDAGQSVLRVAAVAAATGIPKVSSAAYRVLSAARSHQWSVAKALSLGWQPKGLYGRKT
jgi:nucleoside-diphosphate-sugar epimerase